MTRLTEDDPLTNIPTEEFNELRSNELIITCPDCEGRGSRGTIGFDLLTCNRCNGSGGLTVSSNGVVQENKK